jgi:hypothetical protein
VADKTLVDECFEQAMRGADGKSAGLSQLAQTNLSAGLDNLLEEAQRPLDSLDPVSVSAYRRRVLRGFQVLRHADNPIRLDGGGNVL